MASAAKKRRICKLRDSWFSEPEFNGIISKSHLRNTDSEVFCLIYSKTINISHQGRTDLVRHCTPLDVTARKAEVKITGFLAEHNLPVAVADHIGPLLKDIFPDSKIASAYACDRTKSTCILNRAIKPDLQATLTDQMRESCFSISTDGSNDQ